jgi:hypothetical protein
VMLAGDATDTLEQLHARRADAVGPDPAVHVATLDTILAHCAGHPTVYLPSHDPRRRPGSPTPSSSITRPREELPCTQSSSS